ncbi:MULTISPECIES: peptidoglycan-binding domain-containing protein [Streptomyces violaceusniger group]|uniref:Peptidoglycan binding-like domain-containing protein n=2 Tax=Streptomyces javensis TaxID=114698 RepID=A0ABP4HTW6_9ACTN|nr:peptidoglycan-binding domain-containing protein [Streptomyces javensis]MBI0317479.1 peptidoglycan-binding protein [Streptomyces javensis]
MSLISRAATFTGAALLSGGLIAAAPAATAAPAAAPAATSASPAAYGCTPVTSHPTISRGSAGPAVREAQCLLVHWGYSGYLGNPPVDGDFGTHTYNAVVAFQKGTNSEFHCGYAVDGIVGPDTWHALTHPGC